MTAPEAPVTPWKSVAQVAAIAACGQKRVTRAIHRGELRAAKLGVRTGYRIHEDWIREWLEALATPVEIVRVVRGGRR